MEIIYKDEAWLEGIEAARWYEDQSEGLQLRFLRKWKEAETAMAAGPEINRDLGGGLRRRRFEVFPYALVYRILPSGGLEVLAVMHMSRHPGYWNGRLGD